MTTGTEPTLTELTPEQQLAQTAKDQLRTLVATLNQIEALGQNITVTPSLSQNDYAEWICSLVVRKTVYL